MPIYLGLGSNQGNRREHLERAISALAADGVAVGRISPVVESPALLPDDAPPEWNRPFLNLVLECAYAGPPTDLLRLLKSIEARFGRLDGGRWSPRPIDVDILLWNDLVVAEPDLTVPHPALTERAFVMSPLAALAPGLRLPGDSRTVLARARDLAEHIPLWMGIVNLTPDSFSDGGLLTTWDEIEPRIEALVAGGAHLLDLGAESTRPGATRLTPHEELARLEPVLERVQTKYAGRFLRPIVSVDTYHAEVARQALELGADMINDVSGLTAPDMLELAATSDADWVAMHQLSLPADPRRTLARDVAAVDQVAAWLDARLDAWTRAGIDTDRIVFDPGVGFGKNALQSLELLRRIECFQRCGLRLLVGHSRKSFMHGFTGADNALRDLATIGASLRLCGRNVEILRVHDVAGHAAAYRGWSHLA